jgi:hypothetical protein
MIAAPVALQARVSKQLITVFRYMLASGVMYFRNAARFADFSTLRHATILYAAVLAGCTNLQSAGELQENIRSGKAVNEGETVRIVTRDGVSRTLVVTAVQEKTLFGYAQAARTDSAVIEIPIDEILTLEVMTYDAKGQSAQAFGGIQIAIAVFFILAALFGLG